MNREELSPRNERPSAILLLHGGGVGDDIGLQGRGEDVDCTLPSRIEPGEPRRPLASERPDDGAYTGQIACDPADGDGIMQPTMNHIAASSPKMLGKPPHQPRHQKVALRIEIDDRHAKLTNHR